MNNKKIIIGVSGVLVVCLIIAGILYKNSRTGGQTEDVPKTQEVSMEDPIDIVLDFYSPWLEAAKSTSTNPYTSGFATEKILSEELRTRLMSTESDAETEIDPVLCQTTFPTRVTGRIVSEQDDLVRVLVVAKDAELTAQSTFTLKRHNEGWFIDSILCSPGEFELPREFTFEKEGFLLKNVPPPLNSEYWHIIFEENGQLGHAVPLLFDAESSCIPVNKSSEVCIPEQFTEAVKVHVYGQMTELGAEVDRLEFIEEL